MHAASCKDGIMKSFNNVLIAKVIGLLLKVLGKINTCAIFEIKVFSVSVPFQCTIMTSKV